MDLASGRVPRTMGNKLVSATDSCVAVGCRSASDGPTEIHLGKSDEVTPFDPIVFDGELCTPSKKLSVCSIMTNEVLSTPLLETRTHIRVFANDPMEPDRIFVLYD
jgi:hypothetical protein